MHFAKLKLGQEQLISMLQISINEDKSNTIFMKVKNIQICHH